MTDCRHRLPEGGIDMNWRGLLAFRAAFMNGANMIFNLISNGNPLTLIISAFLCGIMLFIGLDELRK